MDIALAVAVVLAALAAYQVVLHALDKGDLGSQMALVLIAVVNGVVSVYTANRHNDAHLRERVHQKLDEEEAEDDEP
ncbi:MAG TPA: hypothetical protein VHN99_07965 [Deinococcales bacterium]|nr:hypothetical protein [Deinococcales bacterium]